jgi:hypothetical protein
VRPSYAVDHSNEAARPGRLHSSEWPCTARSREHSPSAPNRSSAWTDATSARPRARGPWRPGRSHARAVTPRSCLVLRTCRHAIFLHAASVGTTGPYETSCRSRNRLVRHASPCESAGPPSARRSGAQRTRPLRWPGGRPSELGRARRPTAAPPAGHRHPSATAQPLNPAGPSGSRPRARRRCRRPRAEQQPCPPCRS